MKISIELTPQEVAGLKAYLAELSGEINPKIGKAEITQEIQSLVSANLYSPQSAVSNFINQV